MTPLAEVTISTATAATLAALWLLSLLVVGFGCYFAGKDARHE